MTLGVKEKHANVIQVTRPKRNLSLAFFFLKAYNVATQVVRFKPALARLPWQILQFLYYL